MSASLTGVHFDALGVQVPDAHALIQHQLADVDGDVLGNVTRQHFDLDLAIHEVDDATLLLDALGLALEDDRDRDRQHLVHRDLIEVGVEQLVIDRVELILLDQHARVAARLGQRPREPMSVLTPDSECRIFSSAFGSTAISSAFPFSAP